MMGKVGVRGCAWLLAMAFAVLLLERGVHHHTSKADHHHGVPEESASISLSCALCDLALPVFETFALVTVPSMTGAGPEMGLGSFGSKHGEPLRIAVRGPPTA